MSANLTRRSLATGIGRAGLGLGGLALLPSNASADTPFTSFAFPATGTPTPRTMPDRLAEIKNVLDFGADPTGSADSTAAIQAAINWTGGANRGVIFFPMGWYRVSAPLTFNYDGNLSIAFVGVAGTTISATPSFNDYVFKRALGSPNNTTGGRVFEKLNIQNGAATGGCIQLGSTNGAYIRDCQFNGHVCITTEDSAGNSSQNVLIENCQFTTSGTVAGSHGVIIGGSGTLIGCGINSADTAFRLYGKGFHASGNRAELCNTAWLVGLDSAGTNRGASGFSIAAQTCEGDGTGLWLAGTCSGFTIEDFTVQGHDKSNSGYPLNTTNSQYGIRIGAGMATAGVFSAVLTASVFDMAGFSMGNASSRANNVFIGCQFLQGGGTGVSTILPTNAQTALFINSNVSPIWTYSQLPTGGNVFEGDEFNISDSTTATWGANVTVGGGANHVLVRYNGSNWTVVGV